MADVQGTGMMLVDAQAHRVRGHCESEGESSQLTVQIYVKTLTGKTLAIHARPRDNVALLKARLPGFEGIPPDQHDLFFRGTRLDGSRTLSNYNIQREETL